MEYCSTVFPGTMKLRSRDLKLEALSIDLHIDYHQCNISARTKETSVDRAVIGRLASRLKTRTKPPFDIMILFVRLDSSICKSSMAVFLL
jgi:hypothetical protein